MTASLESSEKPKNDKRSKVLALVTLLLVVLGLIWLCLWLFYFRLYESTDDAYANGNLININPPVSGSVVAFFADDTDLVVEGQRLVQLDTTEYQALYERELSALSRTVLEVQKLYDQVLVSKQQVLAQKIALERDRYDYKQRLALQGTGAVSEQDFVHAKDAYERSLVTLKQAKYELKLAANARGATPIKNHPQIEEQKGNVRSAYYRLKHCTILAPATGYIAQRKVDVGEWVTPATNMMAVIPSEHVWVDANFKETQLTNMRIGQPAVVTFDIYGSKVEYKGFVQGIASGTGSVFSIIPPQNATGNWIKIVQRLPVRISLNPDLLKKYPTRLGLSAEVQVDIRNQDLPMLAPAPTIKPIGITNVYNIHLEEVNAIMDKMVEEILK